MLNHYLNRQYLSLFCLKFAIIQVFQLIQEAISFSSLTSYLYLFQDFLSQLLWLKKVLAILHDLLNEGIPIDPARITENIV